MKHESFIVCHPEGLRGCGAGVFEIKRKIPANFHYRSEREAKATPPFFYVLTVPFFAQSVEERNFIFIEPVTGLRRVYKETSLGPIPGKGMKHYVVATEP